MAVQKRIISLVLAVICVSLICCIPWEARAEAAVSISVQPKSTTVIAGDNATFQVVARNATSHQWYYRTTSRGKWRKVSNNGTSGTYVLKTEARHNGYQYRCLVKNRTSSVYTDVVTLSVVNQEPNITSQPGNVTVNEGKKATFRVRAAHATSYQWYYLPPSGEKWTAVATNGTSSTYTLTTEARHDGYQYRCQVTNSVGSVYSNVVTLTVVAKPVILTQPKNVTVNEGEEASFTIETRNATGYQWYYRAYTNGEWNAVSKNSKAETYTLTAEARHNGYQYRCLAKNSAGSVYSDVVTLKVTPKPVITVQPKDVTAEEGGEATFRLTAENATDYQWYYRTSFTGSWKAVTGKGKSDTYTLTAALRHDGYQYRCLVKNGAGSTYSNSVTLTVTAKAPVFTVQPADAAVMEGSEVSFSVKAGNATGYQWYYRPSAGADWKAVKSKGTSATLTLKTAARHNGYQYRCQAKNSIGSAYSEAATLTVIPPAPTVTVQPADLTAYEGYQATFTVTAKHADEYQWYYRASSGEEWTAVAINGISATYTVTAEARFDGYQYRCLAENAGGSVYSEIATLTVVPVPDDFMIRLGTETIIAQGESDGGFECSPGSGEGSEILLTVISSKDWSVSTTDSSWMNVDKPDSGTARITVGEVEYGRNYSGTLEFTANGNVFSVYVTLNKPNAVEFTVSHDTKTVIAQGKTSGSFECDPGTAAGDRIILDVSCSRDWNVFATDPSWMTVNKTGSGSAEITVEEAEDGEIYVSTLIFDAEGEQFSVDVMLDRLDKSIEFAVEYGAEPVIAQGETSGSIALGKEFTEGDDVTLTVICNKNWTVSAADSDWMTVNRVDSETARIIIGAVEDGRSYSDTVIFTVNGNAYRLAVSLNEKRELGLADILSTVPNGELTLAGTRNGQRDQGMYDSDYETCHDFEAPEGTELYAPMDGYVERAQIAYMKGTTPTLIGYGNRIIFTSEDEKYIIVFGHLSSFFDISTATDDWITASEQLSSDDVPDNLRCDRYFMTVPVKKGDIIGYTGRTGQAEGPLLHIEVYVKDNYFIRKLYPCAFFKKELTVYESDEPDPEY